MPNSCHDHKRYRTGCPSCQAVSRADSQRQRDRQREGKHTPKHPAAAVRAHIDTLRAAGMAITVIAEEAGLSRNAVTKIAGGHQETVFGPTAQAILAVKPRPRPRVDTVPIAGSLRRVRALCAVGHTLTRQARQMGVGPAVVWQIIHATKSAVNVDLAAKIARLYDEWYAVEAPCDGFARRARQLAADHGWYGPEAWTDDTIDDPDAQPMVADIVDEVAVRRALAGQMPYSQLRQPERVEAYRRLVDEGVGNAAIRRRLNINGFTLMRLEALAEQAQSGETCEVAA